MQNANLVWLHFRAVLFLNSCLAGMGVGQVLSGTDSILFEDPGGNYAWIIPSQEVAGADVEMLAFRAYLKKKKDAGQSASDNTSVNFFIPEQEKTVIELRKNNFLSTLKPGAVGWPRGFFQCLKLPNSIPEKISIEAQEVLALGKVQRNPELYIPVVINANLPDSINSYEFKFKPNMDIEVKYSIYQQSASGNWKQVVPENTDEFYPGDSIFPIRWDGRLQGHLAAEGIYKLVIKGKKYPGPQVRDMVREYHFYHKPVYGQCRTI
jgi:hypothetical protein